MRENLLSKVADLEKDQHKSTHEQIHSRERIILVKSHMRNLDGDSLVHHNEGV
jgi:hypothetical protein